MRLSLIVALCLIALHLSAVPIDRETRDLVLAIGSSRGVPTSVTSRLMVEESNGDDQAIGPRGSDGSRCRGLFQINPRWQAYLVATYYPHPVRYFDVWNATDNATVALGYLSALHHQYGTWERALWYFNCGRVRDVPESTREYARRIVTWNKED